MEGLLPGLCAAPQPWLHQAEGAPNASVIYWLWRTWGWRCPPGAPSGKAPQRLRASGWALQDLILFWLLWMKCGRRGGLATTEHYFSQFWRLDSPRSRCRQVRCLVEPAPWFPVAGTLMWWNGRGSRLGPPLYRREPQSWALTSEPNLLPKSPPPNTSEWVIRFPYANAGDTLSPQLPGSPVGRDACGRVRSCVTGSVRTSAGCCR